MAAGRHERKPLDASSSAVPTFRIPHPERVVFPAAGFTKAQVVDFYIRVAPFLLPHLEDLPVTLKRFPDEAGGEFFWEKDAPAYAPDWVRRFPVPRRSGESDIHYILVDNLKTLVWAASVGTLEFHSFLHRVPQIENPTMVVFDLDPGEPANVLDCGRVALLLRELLKRLELDCFTKVSGSKGMQVYVPLNTEITYKETQPFARAVAILLGREHPDMVVSEMERAQRKGRVFIDWSQNADYKTTVAVYSLRAKRRHPYVSMPITWDELKRALDSKQSSGLYFSPEQALERLYRLGDLFAPVLTLRQHLPEAFTVEERSAPEPRATALGRLLHMPDASSQGGRRRFTLWRKTGASPARLELDLHDKILCFDLPDGVPSRQNRPTAASSCSNRKPRRTDDSATALAEDTGTFELIEGGRAKGYLDFYFSGQKFKGELIATATGTTEDQWVIRRPAKAGSGLAFAMRTARNVEQTAPPVATTPKRLPKAAESRKPITARRSRPKPPFSIDDLPSAKPAFVPPMECKLVRSAPDQPHWLFELKLDGYRALAVKAGANADLFSRYGRSFKARFGGIASALAKIEAEDFVLDGEIVALDDQGRPNFQELQNSRSTRQPIVYYAFDVLNYAGKDLRYLPLRQRKQMLQVVAEKFADPVRLAAAVDVDSKTLITQVKKLGLEGVVAKDPESIYGSGKRSGRWLKYRLNDREEFVMGGYIPGGYYLEAILVGRFEGSKLMFVKKVRNGFVPETRKVVFEALQPLITSRCPFANLPEPADRRGAVDAEEMKRCVWVRPELKCEIDFAEWTRGGRLRHAAFRQLTGRVRLRSQVV